MALKHVAVWIDHKEAKVFHIEPEGFEMSKINAPQRHLTQKASEQGSHALREPFFHEVAKALADADEILLVGPSAGKLDLLRHLHKHDPLVEAKVLGVETLDHPSNNQIAAYVRHYFHAKDRLSGNAIVQTV